jgi:hypothetical protein
MVSASSPRIDGSTKDAFWRSYAQVSQGLSGEDLAQFQIAIQRILVACMKIVRSNKPDASNDVDQFEREMQRIVNGLSAQEVVALGQKCGSGGTADA